MRVEVPFLSRVVREFKAYQPTLKERGQGKESSVISVGIVGTINRTIARTFRQEDADIRAFLKGDNFP